MKCPECLEEIGLIVACPACHKHSRLEDRIILEPEAVDSSDSHHNREYSKEIARKVIERVFDRCGPNDSTRGLNTECAEIIFTGLQIAQARGKVLANLRTTSDNRRCGCLR